MGLGEGGARRKNGSGCGYGDSHGWAVGADAAGAAF